MSVRPSAIKHDALVFAMMLCSHITVNLSHLSVNDYRPEFFHIHFVTHFIQITKQLSAVAARGLFRTGACEW